MPPTTDPLTSAPRGLVLQELVRILFLLLAGAIYAVALKYFVLPSKVVLTGTEGISAALSYYFESESLFLILYLSFQTLFILFAFFAVSRPFAIRTLIVVLTVVGLLSILPQLNIADPEPENERIILVIFGGLLAGVAKALAFRSRGSTGDEDIPGAYFATKYLKPVGHIAIFAAIVSTTFGLLLDYLKTGQLESALNTLMYTCIYIFVAAETLNNLYRKFKLTVLTIITRKKEEVKTRIAELLPHRTFTDIAASGGRSNLDYRMMQTIMTHEELPEVKDVLNSIEEVGFYYHQDIEGVSGGYFIRPIS